MLLPRGSITNALVPVCAAIAPINVQVQEERVVRRRLTEQKQASLRAPRGAEFRLFIEFHNKASLSCEATCYHDVGRRTRLTFMTREYDYSGGVIEATKTFGDFAFWIALGSLLSTGTFPKTVRDFEICHHESPVSCAYLGQWKCRPALSNTRV